MNYFKISVLLIAISFTGSAFAQPYTDSRSVTKSFKAMPGTTVDINNKYGKVEVTTWNKDSVRIEANLSIKTSSTTKMMKLRNMISFDISATGHYILARTVFTSSGFISDLKDWAESLVSGAGEVSIDYTIKMPASLNLKITNKYGDVYTDNISGEVQISLANGGLKANDFTGITNIDLSFGDGYINSMTNGRIILSYANLSLKNTNQCSLESKSSKIDIDHAESLKMNMKRDKLNIGNVRYLTGQTYFADIWITNLSDEINIDTQFGKLTAITVDKGFSFINVRSEYTDLDFSFEHGSAFDYDLTYYKDVFLQLPKEAVKNDEKTSSTDMSMKTTFGHVGNSTSNKMLKISMAKKASLSIFLK